MIVPIDSHHSSFSALLTQGLLNQEADLNSLGNVGVNVHKIIEQAVAEEKTKEEAVGVGVSVKPGILNEDGHDDGDSHQETVGRYSVEVEQGLASNEKVIILYEILAVSSSIALSYPC